MNSGFLGGGRRIRRDARGSCAARSLDTLRRVQNNFLHLANNASTSRRKSGLLKNMPTERRAEAETPAARVARARCAATIAC